MTDPLSDNLAGALAYFTFIPALVFLRTDPYNRNHFVRFHSFNSLLLHVVVAAAGAALAIIAALLVLIIPFLRVFLLPGTIIFLIAVFTLWLLLVVKAYQNEIFKLPVVGDIAEKQATV